MWAVITWMTFAGQTVLTAFAESAVSSITALSILHLCCPSSCTLNVPQHTALRFCSECPFSPSTRLSPIWRQFANNRQSKLGWSKRHRAKHPSQCLTSVISRVSLFWVSSLFVCDDLSSWRLASWFRVCAWHWVLYSWLPLQNPEVPNWMTTTQKKLSVLALFGRTQDRVTEEIFRAAEQIKPVYHGSVWMYYRALLTCIAGHCSIHHNGVRGVSKSTGWSCRDSEATEGVLSYP